MVYFAVENISDVINSLKNKGNKIKENVQISMIEGGQLLKEEIQASIDGQRAEPRSVDTGNFLNSIELSTFVGGAKVSTDVDYSKFLEYGTSKINERRHFRNSTDRTKPVIIEKVKDAIKTSL
jgi:hypothetical protein